MARTWLIDGRGLANMVKNAGDHDNDNSRDRPRLPTGVKFDPSDVELLKHLAAKFGVGNLEPEELIDKFIPTLENAEGICYTHPENLPESEMGTIEVIPRNPNMNIPDPPRKGQTRSFEDAGNLKQPSRLQYCSRSENQNEFTIVSDQASDLLKENFHYYDKTVNSYDKFGNFCGIGDYDGLELDTLPDFQLHDLQFDWSDQS